MESVRYLININNRRFIDLEICVVGEENLNSAYNLAF